MQTEVKEQLGLQGGEPSVIFHILGNNAPIELVIAQL